MLYDRSMCKVHAAATLALAIGLAGGIARAQTSGDAAPAPRRGHHGSGGTGASSGHTLNSDSQPLNLRKGQYGSDAYTTAARAKMAAGDYDAALELFDAALRTQAEDPTLYRDCGICHEKLGHPHPAMDDYRVYLTESPDAPDADGIRERLERLEDEASGRTSAGSANDDTNVPSANGGPDVPPPSSGAKDKVNPEDMTDGEDPDNSLRSGKGFSLAPWFSLKHYSFKDQPFAEAENWSESVGGQLRYSFGSPAAIVVEAGYEHFNSTVIDTAVISGLTSFAGLELRFPLNTNYDDQILLVPGVGYEHLSFSPSDPGLRQEPANAFAPRLRIGYRHMLLAGTSLDASLDAGVALFFATNQEDLGLSSTFVVALNVGIVWDL